MRIHPVNNDNYKSGSRKSIKDTSAKIDTTDSFRRNAVREPSFKNLADIVFDKGNELNKAIKNSSGVVVESALDKNDRMTIRTLIFPDKDGGKLSNIHCLSDGTLVGIRGRDTQAGNRREHTLVFMKPNMREKAEVALHTRERSKTDLISTPDGRVLARDGDEWRCFSSDGKEMWKTPCTDMGNRNKSLTVANDGTVINRWKNKTEPGKGDFIVSAIAPDGSKKWEKSIKQEIQTADTEGNVYFTSPDGKSYTKIDTDGNESEVFYSREGLPSSVKAFNMEVTGSGKVIMQMKMVIADSPSSRRTFYPKYIVQPGKKPIPLVTSNFRTTGGIIDGPDGSTIGVAGKDNRGAELVCFDKDGNKAWQRQLPLSNLQNNPFVDNNGRIFVMTNSMQRPPNIYSGTAPAKSSLTCYDKQGNKLWEHEMKNDLNAGGAVIFPNGTITISHPFNNKLTILKPGVDTGEDFIHDILEQAVEDDQAHQEPAGQKIQKSTDGKSLNIGGVKLPIRQYNFIR